MRCLFPMTVGFKADGKTIVWSEKEASKQFAPFQLPCSKCIECRLEQARSKAVRCVHEARMHEQNSFVTLTYSEEKLESPWLIKDHIQKFNKRLRERFSKQSIPIVYTGEYGDEKKRPHWHALIFNWSPDDKVLKYTNDTGDRVYTSSTLGDLWDYGNSEIGEISFKSAGYVCRYAAKKLIHGQDKEHPYQPIHQFGGRLHTIGKSFLEKYYTDIFAQGHCIMRKEDGSTYKTAIPKYYERWLLKHKPEEWISYVTRIKADRASMAAEKADQERKKQNDENIFRYSRKKGKEITKQGIQKRITEENFKKLQSYLKGDI